MKPLKLCVGHAAVRNNFAEVRNNCYREPIIAMTFEILLIKIVFSSGTQLLAERDDN
jgi:hypothetical protein